MTESWLDTCGLCPFFKHKKVNGNGYCKIQKKTMHCSFICPFIVGDVTMTARQSERILHHHQKWRRGDCRKMMSCKLLGLAIDNVIRITRKVVKEEGNGER